MRWILDEIFRVFLGVPTEPKMKITHICTVTYAQWCSQFSSWVCNYKVVFFFFRLSSHCCYELKLWTHFNQVNDFDMMYPQFKQMIGHHLPAGLTQGQPCYSCLSRHGDAMIIQAVLTGKGLYMHQPGEHSRVFISTFLCLFSFYQL